MQTKLHEVFRTIDDVIADRGYITSCSRDEFATGSYVCDCDITYGCDGVVVMLQLKLKLPNPQTTKYKTMITDIAVSRMNNTNIVSLGVNRSGGETKLCATVELPVGTEFSIQKFLIGLGVKVTDNDLSWSL